MPSSSTLAIIQRGAAVAAAGVEQADAAMPVTEQDQILCQRADLFGDIGCVSHKTDRVPVTPQQFPPSGWRARPRSVRSGRRTASWHRRCRDRDLAG